MTNQSELERMLIKLCWVTAPSNQDDVDKVLAYINANYTPNSGVAQHVQQARIDEVKRTRPYLTYPGMVYYGERINELQNGGEAQE